MSDSTFPPQAVTSNFISASAGTGKTYQLSSRFIALLALGYKADEMIALTFTNKAAGEFRNRILHDLAEGACEHPKNKRNKLAARVWEAWSAMTYDKNGTPVTDGDKVPIYPPSQRIIHLAHAKGVPPEVYHEENREQLKYTFPVAPVNTARFQTLLTDVVRSITKLKLYTIDSFFNRLVCQNSMDIGGDEIKPITGENETAGIIEAVKDLLDAKGADETTTRNFLDDFEVVVKNKSAAMLDRLNKDASDYRTLYLENPDESTWGNISAFGLNLETPPASSEKFWSEWNARIDSLLPDISNLPTTITKAIASYRAKIENGNFDIGSTITKWMIFSTDDEKKLLQATQNIIQSFDAKFPIDTVFDDFSTAESIAQKSWWPAPRINAICELKSRFTATDRTQYRHVAKTTQLKDYICNLDTEKYLSSRKEVINLLKEGWEYARIFNMEKYVKETKSLYHIIQAYDTIYRQQIVGSGRYTFQDIAETAHDLMQEKNAVPSKITFKLDCQLKHWMLDEFQDTADSQFDTLRPALQEIAQEVGADSDQASTRSLFMVGDDKQSIYSFRTGDSDVFRTVRQPNSEWAASMQESGLTESFRSSHHIMGENGFINQLFKKLNDVEHHIAEADHTEAISLEHFCNHRAHFNDIPGYIRLEMLAATEENADNAADDDSNIEKPVNAAITRILKELTTEDEHPINGISIAILVRTNKEADEILDHLHTTMKKLPVVVVKDTYTALNSPMGEMLFSFFKWLQHPSNDYRKAVVHASPLAKGIFSEKYSDNAAHAYWLKKLSTCGYHSVIESLLSHFGPELQCGETARLWLSAALSFDISGGSLNQWVTLIPNMSNREAATPGTVQIMTIHKSKGLEFDAVILPYTESASVEKRNKIRYLRTRNGILLSPGESRIREIYPELLPVYMDTCKKNRREAYNLLYVAATRARCANYFILHGKELDDTSSGRSISGLIRRAFGADSEEVPQNTTLATFGNIEWFKQVKDKSATRQEVDTPTPLGQAIPRRKRVSPSNQASAEDKQKKEEEDKPSHAVVYGGASDGADFGTKVHETWEQITWLADDETHPFSVPQNDEQEVVYEALQQPAVAALFTRCCRQEVYNEQSVEAINDDDEWISASIDRLVLTNDANGQVVAAHIIDFKTNKPVPRDGYSTFEDWLIDHYAKQMRAYRELISKAFDLPEHAVTVSLISCPKEDKAKVLTYTEEKLKEKKHS